MPKVTAKYEAFLVIDNSIGEEAVKAVAEKFTNLIAANGSVESVDEWGVRKFAYPINDMTEGYYVLYNFTSNPEFPAELDRVCNITDEVLRSLVISKE
ncbi:MAG: 30S ribosomal protein S6 [Oscillospiraceae bacterium]|nr:30S ribosomal protein S6 [Oscillospiraceae bacterium]MBQ8869438.1 30S ribosomal protein S6 [Oscillospiraceae bacterium]